MKLELLQKLVRLANNNPNDNEANLAARKVCKMLEECNFNLGYQPPPSPKAQTWNDIRRSEEPMWRSKPPNYTPRNDKFWDLFDEMLKGGKVDWSQQQGSWTSPPRNNPSGDNPFYKSWVHEPRRKEKSKRPLKCKRCNQEFMTAFIGIESQFQCNKCHWETYNEKAGK